MRRSVLRADPDPSPRSGRRARIPCCSSSTPKGPLATTWGPYPIVDDDGRWLIVVYYTGTDSNDVWYYDLEQWRKTGTLERRDLLVGEDALTDGFIDDDVFYAVTTFGASNKRVLAFDLAAEEPARYREVLAARPDAVIVGIARAPDASSSTISRMPIAGSRRSIGTAELQRGVTLPGIGSAAIVTHPEREDRVAAFRDVQRAGRDLSSRPCHGPQRVCGASRSCAPLPADAPVVVKQVRYRSRDGVEIPMFLVHREDLHAGRRESDGALRLRWFRHFVDAELSGGVAAMARARRRLRDRESARWRRVRSGLASRGNARPEADRVRRLLCSGRVADRAALHAPRAARDQRPLERRALDRRCDHAAAGAVCRGHRRRAVARHAAVSALPDGALLGAGVRQRGGSGSNSTSCGPIRPTKMS